MSIDFANISLKELAGLISSEMEKNDAESVLVGGACVSIYSENKYLSYDLDFVSYEERKKIKKILNKIGFYEKGGYFVHPECKWFVEFVAPPVAIGNEPIREFNLIKTSFGTIKLLHPTDCVKDRLAAFYHWNDKQSLEQAIMISKDQAVDLIEIENWSKRELNSEKFSIFLNLLKTIS